MSNFSYSEYNDSNGVTFYLKYNPSSNFTQVISPLGKMRYLMKGKHGMIVEKEDRHGNMNRVPLADYEEKATIPQNKFYEALAQLEELEKKLGF